MASSVWWCRFDVGPAVCEMPGFSGVGPAASKQCHVGCLALLPRCIMHWLQVRMGHVVLRVRTNGMLCSCGCEPFQHFKRQELNSGFLQELSSGSQRDNSIQLPCTL